MMRDRNTAIGLKLALAAMLLGMFAKPAVAQMCPETSASTTDYGLLGVGGVSLRKAEVDLQAERKNVLDLANLEAGSDFLSALLKAFKLNRDADQHQRALAIGKELKCHFREIYGRDDSDPMKSNLALITVDLANIHFGREEFFDAADGFRDGAALLEALHQNDLTNFNSGSRRFFVLLLHYAALERAWASKKEQIVVLRQADQLGKRLLSAEPVTDDFRESFAESQQLLGALLAENYSSLKQAIPHFENARTHFKTLLNDDPNSEHLQREYSRAVYDLAEAHYESGTDDTPVKVLEEHLRWIQAYGRSHPKHEFNRSNTYLTLMLLNQYDNNFELRARKVVEFGRAMQADGVYPGDATYLDQLEAELESY